MRTVIPLLAAMALLPAIAVAPAAEPALIDVAKYPGPQAALDAVPETGAAVYFPVGTYRVDAPLVVKLAEGRHLTLRGEGRGSVLVNANE